MNEANWQALCRALSLAGIEYADFQRVVTIFFFGWKCEVDSEGLADVTLDRLGQKLNQGEVVRNFTSYSKNIAYKVYLEYCRDREKLRAAMRELWYLTGDMYDPEKDINVRRECQKTCVKRLSQGAYQLMVDYYLTGKDRSVLAADLGIPLATLRTKIHRIYKRLEKCTEDCRRLA